MCLPLEWSQVRPLEGSLPLVLRWVYVVVEWAWEDSKSNAGWKQLRIFFRTDQDHFIHCDISSLQENLHYLIGLLWRLPFLAHCMSQNSQIFGLHKVKCSQALLQVSESGICQKVQDCEWNMVFDIQSLSLLISRDRARIFVKPGKRRHSYLRWKYSDLLLLWRDSDSWESSKFGPHKFADSLIHHSV